MENSKLKKLKETYQGMGIYELKETLSKNNLDQSSKKILLDTLNAKYSEMNATNNNAQVNASYVSDYGTASFVSIVVSFIGWVTVVGSLILLLISIDSLSGRGGFAIFALLPSLGGIISGLLLVVAGQITRATADTANSSREMLELMKNSKNNNINVHDNKPYNEKSP